MKIALLLYAPPVTGLQLIPGSADAHYGWQEFDENAEVTVEGTVMDFHYQSSLRSRVRCEGCNGPRSEMAR
jgi:hypothetical protein